MQEASRPKDTTRTNDMSSWGRTAGLLLLLSRPVLRTWLEHAGTLNGMGTAPTAHFAPKTVGFIMQLCDTLFLEEDLAVPGCCSRTFQSEACSNTSKHFHVSRPENPSTYSWTSKEPPSAVPPLRPRLSPSLSAGGLPEGQWLRFTGEPAGEH